MLLSAILVVSLLTGPVEAATKGPAKVATIIGLGASTSCETWTTARRDQKASALEQWMLGYLSGMGKVLELKRIDPLRGVDPNGVWTWIDNYCKANPLDLTVNAGTRFLATSPH